MSDERRKQVLSSVAPKRLGICRYLCGGCLTVGSLGQDTFTFNPGFRNNTITDFNTSHDVLNFNPALFANYAAAMVDTKQVEFNTVITYDATDTVTLTGVMASHLTGEQLPLHVNRTALHQTFMRRT
jgi:hypothetical protein